MKMPFAFRCCVLAAAAFVAASEFTDAFEEGRSDADVGSSVLRGKQGSLQRHPDRRLLGTQKIDYGHISAEFQDNKGSPDLAKLQPDPNKILETTCAETCSERVDAKKQKECGGFVMSFGASNQPTTCVLKKKLVDALPTATLIGNQMKKTYFTFQSVKQMNAKTVDIFQVNTTVLDEKMKASNITSFPKSRNVTYPLKNSIPFNPGEYTSAPKGAYHKIIFSDEVKVIKPKPQSLGILKYDNSKQYFLMQKKGRVSITFHEVYREEEDSLASHGQVVYRLVLNAAQEGWIRAPATYEFDVAANDFFELYAVNPIIGSTKPLPGFSMTILSVPLK